MKHITISISDELYGDMLDYAADQSKKNVRRLNMCEVMRTLIAAPLQEQGYRRALVNVPQMSSPPRQADDSGKRCGESPLQHA
jgi:hypothetical protein